MLQEPWDHRVVDQHVDGIVVLVIVRVEEHGLGPVLVALALAQSINKLLPQI